MPGTCCLHTPHNKTCGSRGCCHSFSDGETEAHIDEGTYPRSVSGWWSQDLNLGTWTIIHVLRHLRAENNIITRYPIYQKSAARL